MINIIYLSSHRQATYNVINLNIKYFLEHDRRLLTYSFKKLNYNINLKNDYLKCKNYFCSYAKKEKDENIKIKLENINNEKTNKIREAVKSAVETISESGYSVMEQNVYGPNKLAKTIKTWRLVENVKNDNNLDKQQHEENKKNEEEEQQQYHKQQNKQLNEQQHENQHINKLNEERIKSYSGMLHLILPTGTVTELNRNFLSTYRDMIQITQNEHEEALKRYGWTQEEYINGKKLKGPQPLWNKLYNKFKINCNQNGNAILLCGSICSLCAIIMTNIIYLRLFNLVGGISYCIFNITRSPPLWATAYWNIVFMILNTIMIIFLLLERRPESFTDEELDVFERFFLPVGLGPRQFRKLLHLATWQNVPERQVLIQQGTQVPKLFLLYKGKLSVFINGHEIENLEEGDRNAIIGVKTFLTKLEYLRKNIVKPGMYFSADSKIIEQEQKQEQKEQKEDKQETPLATANEIINNSFNNIIDNQSLITTSNIIQSNLISSDNIDKLNKENNEIISENNKIPKSATTIVTNTNCIILSWDIDELLQLVTRDPVNIGFPVVGGFARTLVSRSRTQLYKQSIGSYETVMNAVLSDGEITSQEKKLLRECRAKYDISEEKHWELVEKFGWTREEFEDGLKHNNNMTTANRAIRSVITSIVENIRRTDISNEERNEII